MDMRAFNEDVIRRFRAGEEIEGLHRERLLLLTTTGHRTGLRRTAPMMFVRFDGDPLVIASNDGAADHPAWLLNLRADPHATVETPDGDRCEAVAEELSGDERTVEWEDLVAEFPFFAEQQQRAGDRVIPLVRLRTAS
ncbi:nitroreductase/quinone reductase family protein [Amnibacterium sp.]|uniref:nitroreductase/quinone reductase family protein n=1 Tax=Amnibacterium sp. TaxID=1872496 RepID=UPI003F7BEFD8